VKTTANGCQECDPELQDAISFLSSGRGQTKNRGEIDAEPGDMALEAEPQFCVGNNGIEARISLRVRANPRAGDRPVIDVQAAEVDLSLGQARNLLDWLNQAVSRLDRANSI